MSILEIEDRLWEIDFILKEYPLSNSEEKSLKKEKEELFITLTNCI